MARIARVLALIALAAPAGAAPALSVQTVEPRPFGYTVGDVLVRRVLVASGDAAVDPASLPKPGRYGRWFALREATALSDGARLVYQLVNSPPQPDQENLPSLTLRLIGPDGRAWEAQIGPFTVAMSPVAHFGPYDVIQADDLRADLEPRPIDTRSRRQRVFGYGAGLLALAGVGLVPALARRLGWRRAGPFVRAWRALRRAPLRGDDAAARRGALRRLHQALDEAAGRTLALDNVEGLLQAQPWLTPARQTVQALLAESRAAFFGEAAPPPRARLLRLAAQLAGLERHR
jgi:mxaA protein